jgi:nicotinate dehydrogenase large molybdopterin subunit
MSTDQEKRDQFSCIGHSVPRIDALDKVLGRAVYAEDISFPNMLYGRVLRARTPHAMIEEIDISKAQAMKGVACVLTSKDVPGVNRYGIAFQDQYALAEDRVRFVGEPVALVAAETEEISKDAIKAIRVRYRELPVIMNPHQALADGAPLIHEKGNLLLHSKIRKGSVELGFSQADVIVENTYRTHVVDHAYMETESGMGRIDEHGNIVIWSANQCPFRDRRQVAGVLGIRENKVRVIRATTGGAFGGKDDITVEIHIGLLVQATKRPVRLVLEREESFLSQTKRHAIEIWTRWGATKDGKLCVMEGKVYGDKGPYAGLGAFVIKKCGLHLSGPYYIPNIKVDSYSLYTNNLFGSAMRGFGVAQAAIAHEAQMDELAKNLRMDPLEFRLRNALDEGLSTPTGQTFYEGVGIKATLHKLEEVRSKDPSLRNDRSRETGTKKRGIGIGSMFYGLGYGFSRQDVGAATVEICEDGSVIVRSGEVDYGQGSDTIFCQMVAEELGIRYDDIQIVTADTFTTPNAGPTSASRVTYVTGNAVLRASRAIKETLRNVAENLLGERDLVFVDEEIHSESHPDKKIGFKKLSKECHNRGLQMVQTAWYDNTTKDVDHETGQGDAYSAYAYASQLAELEVDTETGKVDVLRIVSATDAGKAINPSSVEGQIEGGAVMGIGYGLTEEIKVEKGYLKTESLGEYMIPTSLDVPRIDPHIIEVPVSRGPYGAKGVGEPALIPTTPAILNAIADAVGVRVTELPANLENLHRLIREKEGTQK